jgi:flagellar biosynthetic protein FliR
MTGLEDIAVWMRDTGVLAGLVFLRIGAAMALLPAFGEQVVPVRVRLGITVALSALVLPLVGGIPLADPTPGPLMRMGAVEVLVGLALGLTFRVMVIALQVAGSIAAASTSLAQAFGAGLGADPQPAISTLLVIAALALACAAGLPVRVVEALVLSYQLFPMGGAAPDGLIAAWAVADVARAFALAFALAAPFAVAALVYNLALGAISRAMPQLMVVLIGAPALTLGSLVLMALAAPVLLSAWLAQFHGVLAAPFAAGR